MYALTREKGNLAIRRKAKQQLNERLKVDGQWKDYCKLREFLKREGMPESDAWLVAGIPFPPKDGSPHELGHLPQYSEIVDAWKDGKWPKPPDFVVSEKGITDFTKTVTEPTPEAKAAVKKAVEAPNNWAKKWADLAEKVGVRQSSELDDARWVVANYLREIDKIKPEEVPSAAALSILKWVQLDVGNFGDFLRSIYSKILPDRKTIEYESKFSDDGREIEAAFEEIQRSFLLETETGNERPITSTAAADGPTESGDVAALAGGHGVEDLREPAAVGISAGDGEIAAGAQSDGAERGTA